MHTYYNFIFSASPEMSVQSGKIPEECSFSLAANIRIFLCGVTDWTITVHIRADVKGYLWKKKRYWKYDRDGERFAYKNQLGTLEVILVKNLVNEDATGLRKAIVDVTERITESD